MREAGGPGGRRPRVLRHPRRSPGSSFPCDAPSDPRCYGWIEDRWDTPRGSDCFFPTMLALVSGVAALGVVEPDRHLFVGWGSRCPRALLPETLGEASDPQSDAETRRRIERLESAGRGPRGDRPLRGRRGRWEFVETTLRTLHAPRIEADCAAPGVMRRDLVPRGFPVRVAWSLLLSAAMRGNPMAESQAADPRLSDALERVYESSQNVLLTRIDLLVAEVRALLRDALLSVIGALVVLGGVSWISYALFRQLDAALPTAAAALLVGLVEGAIGAALLVRARRPAEAEETS